MMKLTASLYTKFLNKKDQAKELLNSEKGGIENYVVILIITAIALIIGWALWKYFAGDKNVIADWFQSNVGKITDCTKDASNPTC